MQVNGGHPLTRLLTLLELLQAYRRLSGGELARRLGVAPRTVRRYVSTLREIGIPVDAEAGRRALPPAGAHLLPGPERADHGAHGRPVRGRLRGRSLVPVRVGPPPPGGADLPARPGPHDLGGGGDVRAAGGRRPSRSRPAVDRRRTLALVGRSAAEPLD